MSERTNTAIRLARGVLVSSLVSLAMMAALAMCVVYMRLTDGTIQAVNQVIKLLSLCVGVRTCVKPGSRRGFFLGGALGLLYMALGHGLYGLLGGIWPPYGLLAAEFTIGALLAALFGALLSNLPVRRRASRA